MKKIYCYVDETGQDTNGKLFIVVVIVIKKEKNDIIKKLENIEIASKKKKTKWHKAHIEIKVDYIKQIGTIKELKEKIFFKKFASTKEYEDLTNLTIARAINRYNTNNNIKEYKSVIIIDGLKKTERVRVSRTLRELGIKIEKIRGTRDESNSLIRLADALAGFIRNKKDNNKDIKQFNNLSINKEVIIELD